MKQLHKTNILGTQYSWQALQNGMRDGIPIGLGYFAVSFSLGIAAKNAGLTPFQGFLASLLCNASAGEYAGFTLIAAGATYLEVAVVTLIANARYLLMSCAMSQRLDPHMPGFHRPLMAFHITDELFGIAIARPGCLNPFYSYGAVLVAAPCWAVGTALGAIAGGLLPQRIQCHPLRHVPGSHHSGRQKKQGGRRTDRHLLRGQLWCGTSAGHIRNL